MSDYKVGYKKPPKKSQFKPGQSGNPRGRIKGHRNIKTDLKEELNELVTITENGRPKRISKQQVILKQLCTKAISGDPASARLLANLILRYLADEPDEGSKREFDMPAEDKALLDHFIKNQGGKND